MIELKIFYKLTLIFDEITTNYFLKIKTLKYLKAKKCFLTIFL